MTATLESVVRRVLGGFIFVDSVTSMSIGMPLNVTSDELLIKGNNSGIYGIFDGPGFRDITGQFTPTGTWPPQNDFEITVSDVTMRYLPRRAKLKALPQQLAGTFTLQQVSLYPSPSSAVELNWAIVRASAISNTGAPLPWSLVRVFLNSNNAVLATGMSDERGEALLAVAGRGLQVSDQSTDPVTEATEAVTVQAWFDPTVLTQPKDWIPNPDEILGNLGSLKTGSKSGALAPRQTLFAPITISV